MPMIKELLYRSMHWQETLCCGGARPPWGCNGKRDLREEFRMLRKITHREVLVRSFGSGYIKVQSCFN